MDAAMISDDEDDSEGDPEGALLDTELSDDDILQTAPKEAQFDITEHFQATSHVIDPDEDEKDSGDPKSTQLL